MSAFADQTFDATKVSRFVSTLAGTYRCFYLYNKDNKVFDEIMENLAKRFRDFVDTGSVLEIDITNRSFIYNKSPTGFGDITFHLASDLFGLGYKKILFRAPIQSRHFFQLLHILSNKESYQAKNEKLAIFVDDEEPKEISIVPATSSTIVANLPDDIIVRRLSHLKVKNESYLKKISIEPIVTFPDLYTVLLRNAPEIDESIRTFTINIIEAVRDGFFATDRFLQLFPLPEKVKFHFQDRLKQGKTWDAKFTLFTQDEVNALYSLRKDTNQQYISEDLNLTKNLLNQKGSVQTLGFCYLLRYLTEDLEPNLQEKAVHLGMESWNNLKENKGNSTNNSFSSPLRQKLLLQKNLDLSMFPMRNTLAESSEFSRLQEYLISLGSEAMPPIIKMLETEQDRTMRKKLCAILSNIAKIHGVEKLLEAIPKSSTFLLRNLLMILGDLKVPNLLSTIVQFTEHPQKIVRQETLKALTAINTKEVNTEIMKILYTTKYIDNQETIVDHFVLNHIQEGLEALFRLERRESTASPWRRKLFAAMSKYGGPQVVNFFKENLKNEPLFGLTSVDRKEEFVIIKSFLDRGSK